MGDARRYAAWRREFWGAKQAACATCTPAPQPQSNWGTPAPQPQSNVQRYALGNWAARYNAALLKSCSQ